MSNQFATSSPAQGAEESAVAFANPSVAHCCEAGTRAYRTAMGKGQDTYNASKAAHQAFRNALPRSPAQTTSATSSLAWPTAC